MFTQFDTIHKRDGQMDRQTDTARHHKPRVQPGCAAVARQKLVKIIYLFILRSVSASRTSLTNYLVAISS